MSDSHLLSVRDLTITFDGVRAVDGVSFEVAPASITALIGPNGAGKTTVLNSISGFVPARGSIRWRDIELLARPAHARAALGIGRTFQNLQLFGDMTLLDNVLVGQHARLGGNVLLDMLRFPVLARERMARARAIAVLELLELLPFADRQAAHLPFGVQKLAGVARALSLAPRLLLLDEPAAGLNREEAERFGHFITSLRAELGLTILLVEHNMRLVSALSEHLVVLDGGRVLADGPPHEVLADPQVVAAYLGTEAVDGLVERA